MTSQQVLNLGQDALNVMLLVSGPMLVAALVIGLVVSIVQAATQINEMTLSFIPKILGIFATLLIFGPWMLATLVDYTKRVLANIPNIIG
ncbi:flagellar biosynthetic protein FliQ [Candidatus Saccharibacteria bacterium]|nr:flagellar biosynthetic protein FliQ [Candidatus Saccharibacteria bacterium]